MCAFIEKLLRDLEITNSYDKFQCTWGVNRGSCEMALCVNVHCSTEIQRITSLNIQVKPYAGNVRRHVFFIKYPSSCGKFSLK